MPVGGGGGGGGRIKVLFRTKIVAIVSCFGAFRNVQDDTFLLLPLDFL